MAAWLLSSSTKKSPSKVLENINPLCDFVLRVLHFLMSLINFILSSFSRLLNTDKSDIAYSSKSHKFISCVTRLIHSRPDDEDTPCFFITK